MIKSAETLERIIETTSDYQEPEQTKEEYSETRFQKATRRIAQISIFSSLEFNIINLGLFTGARYFENKNYLLAIASTPIIWTAFTMLNYKLTQLAGNIIYNVGEWEFYKRQSKDQNH